MQTLTIKAVSPDSARAFRASLAGFEPELIAGDDGWLVTVQLGGRGKDIVDVLNALRDCVTARGDGPTVVGIGATTYTLDSGTRPAG